MREEARMCSVMRNKLLILTCLSLVRFQDSHKEIAPTRLPTAPSFSSWVPTEKMGYQPLAPLAVNYEYRYKNDYPGAPEYRPQRAYSQIFDDTVSTGKTLCSFVFFIPLAHSLIHMLGAYQAPYHRNYQPFSPPVASGRISPPETPSGPVYFASSPPRSSLTIRQ